MRVLKRSGLNEGRKTNAHSTFHIRAESASPVEDAQFLGSQICSGFYEAPMLAVLRFLLQAFQRTIGEGGASNKLHLAVIDLPFLPR